MHAFCGCCAEVYQSFLFMQSFINFNAYIFLILDDCNVLNAEEKAFVDDPANAHLFCRKPSTEVPERKRSQENQDCVCPGEKEKNFN